jgi:clan AA aspartic protease
MWHVNGHVDDYLRALIEVRVAASDREKPLLLSVWIDTAFNGGLVVPRHEIDRLGLKQASITQAMLADGRVVDLQTFTCYLEWFGQTYRTQVVANDGALPLLGTQLLANRRLTIDYEAKTVSVE